MSLVLPCELVVDRFLPTIRAMLATRLADRGLTQDEIASAVGVTQAAVSKYVSGEAAGDPRFREDPRTRETVDTLAAGLANDELDEYDVLAELLSLVHELEDRGPLCELHEEAMPSLRGLGCDLCVRGTDSSVRAEREVLSTVRRAARMIASTSGMARYIPNVGTNVGMALREAEDPADVAAIPGRIYAIGGNVEIPAHPEFGASQHVATAILSSMAVDPEMRAAANVRTDDAILDAARSTGLDPLEFDAEYESRGAHLQTRFEDRGGVPPVVYHRGAFGIEPITYVFAPTAVAVVERLRVLVESARD
ncbi:MAG: thiamine-phosphate synthase family protein [Halodesulfurarchaeum sp.]